ncbi:Rpn family recombination-promoting nuclease/putative transposase [Crocosphaera sp. UHCC 0190]|uniref:Rpn family recombination-promoting nuclease/putative transposase n=1 Tax=Crocosphaera sp. UHCC 0190 TaxID=3110246 RepID=UPI002B1E94D6|nr:Rpn family recombination-promoting nuclease/putative transposase [Crocosphaera sp. UHCC 0190]MEA5508765.1 Rpn family recombination-promoting nuclease/putative transposase [Crocosphaera sp. UHCC 0190]
MYDNVCKFLAERFSRDFANWLLNEPIELTELKPTELSLNPIRADSLIFLQSEEIVLHIESQTSPDEDIPFRMTDYRLRVYRRYPNKEMYQVVIYLKPSNSELVYQNTFELTNLRHQFHVIRLWEEPTTIFMNTPGLLPFAVLSRTDNPTETLTQIASIIDDIPNRQRQSDISASTAILSGLKLDQESIQRILRSDIMRESVIYQEIFHEGEIKAIRKIALNMLKNNMSMDDIVKLTGLTLKEIQQLSLSLNQED